MGTQPEATPRDSRRASPPGAPRRAMVFNATVIVALAVIGLVFLQTPVGRFGWAMLTGSGTTPLDVVLPADPTFRLSAAIDAERLTATGETSLPDGSVIHVSASYWGDAAGIHMSGPQMATVVGGRFAAQFDLIAWPSGPVHLRATFSLSQAQPDDARERYGVDGAGMFGPKVVFDDDTGTWVIQEGLTVEYRSPIPTPEPTPVPADAADPGTFIEPGPMTADRTGHAAARLLDGRVLIVGGDTEVLFDAIVMHPSGERFDPNTGTFSATGPMTVGREYATATPLLDGRVLIVGGYDSNLDATASAEVYVPATDSFFAVGPTSVGRLNHTATALADGRVLVAGGEGAFEVLASAEIFDPATDTFGPVGDMSAARSSHTATLLPDGTVLLAGGMSSIADSASAEIFDPASGTFTLTGSMSTVRSTHDAVVLADGRVLIAGGLGGSDEGQLASAETFEAATGTFKVVGPLVLRRNYHTLTVLGDGRVLVAGGFADGENVGMTEVFDPRTDTFAPGVDLLRTADAPTATMLLDGRVLVSGGSDRAQPAGGQVYVP